MNKTHRRTRLRTTALAGLAAMAGLGASACSQAGSSHSGGSGDSSGGSSGSGPVVIGASLPLTGVLAGFGDFVRWGYKHAISAANATGGVTVDGHKRKVKLIILDSQSNPNQETSNVQQLITQDHVTALLGSCTPALVTPGAIVAERSSVPMVTGCDPVESFTAIQKWKWVWDEFFSVKQLTQTQFALFNSKLVHTNKKIAILHDNSADGLAISKADPAVARAAGDHLVMNQSFPTTATDFSSIVGQAKASGAQIVIVDCGTPQAVSIRKQMAAVGYTPKILDMEKGGEPEQFADALGPLSTGVLVGGYWDPSFPFPGARTLRAEFERQTGQTWSQHIADSDAAAEILLDAISRAGSTSAAKINAAIGQTDKTYVVGPVKFNALHYSILPIVMDQWQDKQSKVVFSTLPRIKPDGKLIFPVPAK